ncbi:MAG TPA: zf-HC2 domain-containing protein [Jatrophihabitans sp.]|nr:zf-HC2 domain-containing protein [Jatrophihabitans sp.]
MTCARYREAASARLDGEPLGVSATALEHHLAACPDCAGWLAAAERAGRGLRISGVTPPDLSTRILDQVVLPAARLNRRRWTVRAGLAVLGVVQWALALPALFGQNVGMPAMSVHAAHESAAWNLAMGASFLAVAVRPARSVGTLPILATFVGVLSVLSVPDLLAGAVGASRLASHAGVLAGLVLVAALSRSERLPAPESASGAAGTGQPRLRRRGAA